MRIVLSAIALAAAGIAIPAIAQPAQGPAISAEAMEERRAQFAWLLGTWRGVHSFGENSNRSGAEITFYLEADGTVSARLDKASAWLEKNEPILFEQLGRPIMRGIESAGGPSSVWLNRASGGSVLDKNTGQWIKLGIIRWQRKTGLISPIAGISDHTDWKKVSGSSTTTQPSEAGSAGTGGATADSRSTVAPADPAPTDELEDKKALRCDTITYPELLNGSTGRIRANFLSSMDTIAKRQSDLPGYRLHPSPIESSIDIPDFISADDYLVLERLEALTNELSRSKGPDAKLRGAYKNVGDLFQIASDRYEAAGNRAAEAFEPCPVAKEPVPYGKLLEADRIVAELKERREKELVPLLKQADQLNEKLTKQVYGEFDDAKSLTDKAKDWFFERSSAALTEAGVEQGTIESLTPQLDALRKSYIEAEKAGNPVSEEQQLEDIKEALRKSGIAPNEADAADQALTMVLTKVGVRLTTYMAQSLGPRPVQLLGAGVSRVMIVKDILEIGNALKNLYSLWGVHQDLMPVALAAKEDHAYLQGLVARYEVFEQEYAKSRKLFEDAVDNSAALSNKEWTRRN